MPFAYEVDLQRNAIFIRATGRITNQELLALSRRIASEPHYDRTLRFVRDNAGVTKDEITLEAFREAAALLKFPLTARLSDK